MFSPLEQFAIIAVFPFSLWSYDLTFFNALLPLTFIIMCLLCMCSFFSYNFCILPGAYQYLAEVLYKFIWGLLKEQAGSRGCVYLSFTMTIFLFILLSNLLSLMPFGIAFTSHIIVTLFLAVTIILALFWTGILKHHMKFLKMFIPECPTLLLFLLIPIELFSYFVRCFSLAIRLSANILAGHTLVFIVSSFVLSLMSLRFSFIFLLVFLLLALLCLEFGVAFLQAYVFVVLFCIYLKDTLYGPSH